MPRLRDIEGVRWARSRAHHAHRAIQDNVPTTALQMLAVATLIATGCWLVAGFLCIAACILALVLGVASLSLFFLSGCLVIGTLCAGCLACFLGWVTFWGYVVVTLVTSLSKTLSSALGINTTSGSGSKLSAAQQQQQQGANSTATGQQHATTPAAPHCGNGNNNHANDHNNEDRACDAHADDTTDGSLNNLRPKPANSVFRSPRQQQQQQQQCIFSTPEKQAMVRFGKQLGDSGVLKKIGSLNRVLELVARLEQSVNQEELTQQEWTLQQDQQQQQQDQEQQGQGPEHEQGEGVLQELQNDPEQQQQQHRVQGQQLASGGMLQETHSGMQPSVPVSGGSDSPGPSATCLPDGGTCRSSMGSMAAAHGDIGSTTFAGADCGLGGGVSAGAVAPVGHASGHALPWPRYGPSEQHHRQEVLAGKQAMAQ